MRVLIPTSGGLDSTTLLWESLTRTNYEIVAVHYPETWLPVRDPAREAAAGAAFEAVAAWLRARTRPFEARRGPVAHSDSRSRRFGEDVRPVRADFRQRLDDGWRRQILATHGLNAVLARADEVRVALNTWNRRRGPELEAVEEPAFRDLAGLGPVLRYPWIGRRAGVWRGRSRLGNLRRIPAELHALTVRCTRAPRPPCGACLPCLARRFHGRWCRGLDDSAFAAVEERIEELACFGQHFDKADPETYRHRHIDRVLADEDGWREWFEAEAATTPEDPCTAVSGPPTALPRRADARPLQGRFSRPESPLNPL